MLQSNKDRKIMKLEELVRQLRVELDSKQSRVSDCHKYMLLAMDAYLDIMGDQLTAKSNNSLWMNVTPIMVAGIFVILLIAFATINTLQKGCSSSVLITRFAELRILPPHKL